MVFKKRREGIAYGYIFAPADLGEYGDDFIPHIHIDRPKQKVNILRLCKYRHAE